MKALNIYKKSLYRNIPHTLTEKGKKRKEKGQREHITSLWYLLVWLLTEATI